MILRAVRVFAQKQRELFGSHNNPLDDVARRILRHFYIFDGIYRDKLRGIYRVLKRRA